MALSSWEFPGFGRLMKAWHGVGAISKFAFSQLKVFKSQVRTQNTQKSLHNYGYIITAF